MLTYFINYDNIGVARETALVVSAKFYVYFITDRLLGRVGGYFFM